MLVEVTTRIYQNVADIGMARPIVNQKLIEAGIEMFAIDEKVVVKEL
jgi:hypothetical protein